MVAGASPPTKTNRTPNTAGPETGSQNMWAKLCVRKGNSPDRPPRPPSPCRVAKDGSHPFKECVTAHWSSGHAPTIYGAKHGAEAADRNPVPVVGELSVSGEAVGRPAVELPEVRMLA